MTRARVAAWLGLALLVASVSAGAACGPPACAFAQSSPCHRAPALRLADCCSSHPSPAAPGSLLAGITVPRAAMQVAAATLDPAAISEVLGQAFFAGRPSPVPLFTLHRSLLL